MRWENLKVEEEQGRQLPGYRDPAVVRTFDAPEALDVRFYEVLARSALNKVPEASRMPFRWTINPYRGCSHACAYCAGGETPILMADGSTKPLSDLSPGDAIYGTVRDGSSRRLAVTRVLAHWSTMKPAFRVALRNGAELVASGDHRFLTTRGWEYVARGAGCLAESCELVGVPDRGGAVAGQMVCPSAGLEVASVEPLCDVLRLYDITTGTGDFIANGVVSHNCFARPTHKYLDFNAGRDFEREIVVKVNAPELVRAELAKPSWKGEHVAMGTNTDPYQWVESRYRLMPGIWEAMRDFANPCSILTKSPLVLRDIELLREIGERTSVSANLSIPTLDEKAWRATEPHTPSPRARLEAVAELNRAGIPTGVLIAPLMPGINDDPAQVEKILELAAEAGATSIGGIHLHLRGEVRQVFFDWLRAHRPDLIPRYEELYRRGAYAPDAERKRVQRLLDRSPIRSGGLRGVEPPPKPPPGPRGPEQAKLF